MNKSVEKSNELVYQVIEDLKGSKIDKFAFEDLFEAIKENNYFDEELCDCEECEDCSDMIDESEIRNYIELDDVLDYLSYASDSEVKSVIEHLDK
jgi:hypothetical protein